jgi:hypothetical protein
VDGVLFNDEYIFDFSLDYESYQSDEKLQEIADTLDNNVQNFHNDSFTGVQDVFIKSQSRYIHHTVSDMQSLIDDSEPLLDAYKGKKLWAEQLIMENELSRLRSNARREINNLLTTPGPLDDESLNRLIQQTTTAVYAYFFGMAIHLVVLEVQSKLDLIEKFYKNVDELGVDFRKHIHTLLEVINKNSLFPDDAAKQLEALYKDLGPFQQNAMKIINSHKKLNTIIKALLVLTFAFLCTWGAGALVGGFLTGLQLSTGIITMGTFTAQVLAFTLASKLAESIIEGRVVFFDSLTDFLLSLGTTALMFLWFHAVGVVVKAMMKALHLSTSMLVVKFMTNYITMMTATTPFFAYQLYERGQLSNKDEWVEFLIVQSILSAVFSGLLISVEGRMMKVGADAKLEATVWGANTRFRWEKLQFSVRRNAIQKEITIAREEWNKIDEMYRHHKKISL